MQLQMSSQQHLTIVDWNTQNCNKQLTTETCITAGINKDVALSVRSVWGRTMKYNNLLLQFRGRNFERIYNMIIKIYSGE